MAAPSFFTAHPASEGETYGEHFSVAMGFSRQLMRASLAAAVHAIFPNFHTTTASERIHVLHQCLETGDRSAIKGRGKPTISPCAEETLKAS